VAAMPSSAVPSPTPRPFRFGVQVDGAGSRSEWVETARRVEGAGYSTITMPDHFTGQLAPVPALQCAADATSTLRVGALVLDNDYRHPVVLAKELATIDVLSDGRLEIGLGAGWMRSDYDQSGIAYDPPGVRIDRMIEAVDIIRGAHAPGTFSRRGDHYTISAYDGLPKPLQTPPPLLIGGGGPRVLRYAAHHADIVGINGTLTTGAIDGTTYDSMTVESVDRKVSVARQAAHDAGRLDAIEWNIRVFMVMVTDDVDDALATISGFTGMPVDEVAASPFALIGPPSKLVDDLRERRERWGFSYAIVGQHDIDAFAPVVAELAGT
jgi:probable F420-dependent oxidoreductase